MRPNMIATSYSSYIYMFLLLFLLFFPILWIRFVSDTEWKAYLLESYKFTLHNAQPCKRAKWARKCRNIQLENIYLHGNECLSIRNKQEMRTSSAYRVKITPSQTKCSWALRACVCVFVRFVCTFNAFKIWQLNNKSSYILFGWCWSLFK